MLANWEQDRVKESRVALINKAIIVCGLLCVCGLVGCMESRHDAYIEGLKIAGDADRSDCKLVYDQGAATHVINSAKISACVNANKRALVEFRKAQERGLEGREITLMIEGTEDKIKRLESMLRTVKRMQIEKKIDRKY